MTGDFDPMNPYRAECHGWDRMTDEERYHAAARHILTGCLGHLLALIIGVLICLLLGSCKTVRYVTVTAHETDTLTQTTLRRDSIYLHDSIYVNQWQAGDTVYSIRDRWHTQYVERRLHDSIYIAIHDTIPQPYPEPEYIDKPLTWWQQTRLHLANVVLCLAGVGLAGWIAKKKFLP